MNRKFKKVISLILIISTLSQSALLLKPKVVEAAGITAGFSAGDIIGTSAQCLFPNGIGGAVMGLAKKLFDNPAAKSAVKTALKDAAVKVAASLGITITTTKAKEASAKVTAVPTSDETAVVQRQGSDSTKSLSDDLGPNAALSNISEKANQDYKKTHCLDLIVHLITTKVIDKMTLKTVDWINSGFQGSPLYIENTGQFFGDIAKEEVESVTNWFACSGVICDQNYPFGKKVMESILTNLQTGIQAEMRFDLNQVLAHGDYTQFKEDFSVGGWAGYTAFLEPQNNPIGNYLLLSQELKHKTQGDSANKIQTLQHQVNISGGFLNQTICETTASGEPYLGPFQDQDPNLSYLDPNFYTLIPPGESISADILGDDNNPTILPEGVYNDIQSLNNSQAQTLYYNDLVNSSTCIKWKTLTPGGVIADQLKTNLNLQSTKLINADSLGENLGLIFDALLNQLVQGGLNALHGGPGSNSVLVAQVNDENPGGSGLTDSSGNPVSLDNTATVDVVLGDATSNILSAWGVQMSYINLINGGPNGPGALSLLGDIITRIGALDYCVPGPNPKWQENAHTKLAQITQAVSLNEQILTNLPPPPLGTTDPTINETYYHDLILGLTGINLNTDSSIGSSSRFGLFMNNTLTKFIDKMTQYYSLNSAPPTERYFLAQYYDHLEDFQADFDTLSNYLTNVVPLIDTLQDIEVALQANADIPANGGVVDETDPIVQTQLALFESMTGSLATQAQLDDLTNALGGYQGQINLLNAHITSCLEEINGTNGNSPYTAPNFRTEYPFTYNNYPGAPTFPAENNSFLPGGIQFTSAVQAIGNDNIDVETGSMGVTVNNPSNDNFAAFRNTIGVY